MSLPLLGAGQEEAESKICSLLRMQVLASVAVIPVFILNDPEPSFDKKTSFSQSLYLSYSIIITNVSSPPQSAT